jgi:hypothetical protein
MTVEDALSEAPRGDQEAELGNRGSDDSEEDDDYVINKGAHQTIPLVVELLLTRRS